LTFRDSNSICPNLVDSNESRRSGFVSKIRLTSPLVVDRTSRSAWTEPIAKSLLSLLSSPLINSNSFAASLLEVPHFGQSSHPPPLGCHTQVPDRYSYGSTQFKNLFLGPESSRKDSGCRQTHPSDGVHPPVTCRGGISTRYAYSRWRCDLLGVFGLNSGAISRPY